MSGFETAVVAIAEGSAASSAYFTVAQTTFTIAYTAYSLTAAQKAKRAARDASLSSMADRTVAIRSSDEPQVIAFGETVAAGVIAYACNHGTKKECLTLVQAFAGHEIDGFSAIKVNDIYLAMDSFGSDGWVLPDRPFYKSVYSSKIEQHVCPVPGGSVTLSAAAAVIDSIAYREVVSEVSQGEQVTLVAGTDYAYTPGSAVVTLNNSAAVGQTLVITYRQDTGGPLLRVKMFKGIAAGERDTDLETNSGGEWTSAAVGKGIARLHITVKWDADVFGSIGLPNFAAVFRGMKVYNFTDGSTSWSSNSARCAGTYLMSDVGFNVPGTRLDASSWQAAQAICDEAVSLDGGSVTEPRYTCNGVLSTDADRRENLRAVLTTMVGVATYSGNTWLCRPGAYVTPTYTLTEDDLDDAGGVSILPAVARRDLFNAVTGRYMSPWPTFLSTSFPPYKSSTFAAQDGGQVVTTDIDLPMVNGAERAQRISKLMLYRHRLGLSFEASFKLSAYPLQPGDTFYLKSKTFGWDTLNSGLGKVFRVEKRSIDPTGSIRIQAREESSAIYAWGYTEATGVDPAPNTALPDPSFVTPLSGLGIRSDVTTFVRLSDGTVVPYAVLYWDAITDAGVLSGGIVRVLWKRADETEWRRLSSPPDAMTIKLSPLAAGELINATVWVENGIGARTSETALVHRVSVDLASALLVASNSANYLGNPTFAGGTALWTFGAEAGTTDVVEFVRQPDSHPYHIPGIPTNAVLSQIGTQAKTIYADSSRFPVERGRTYVAFASILPVNCAGGIQVILFDVAGAIVGYGAIDAVFAQPATPADPSSYKIVDGRITIDRNSPAVSACVRLYKTGTDPGSTTSAMWITKPQVGPIDSPTTPRPEWSASILQTVGTAQIEFGAATEVVEIENSQTDFNITTTTVGAGTTWDVYLSWAFPNDRVTVANTSDDDVTCVVTAVLSAKIYGNNTYARHIAGQIVAPGETGNGTLATKMALVWPNATVSGSLAISRTVTIPAKTTQSFVFLVFHGVFGGGSGTPITYFEEVRLRLRAEVIKR